MSIKPELIGFIEPDTDILYNLHMEWDNKRNELLPLMKCDEVFALDKEYEEKCDLYHESLTYGRFRNFI